jgi:hypothetical protein
MKKLLLLALAACIPFGIAMAQDPLNFHIVYGNTDGTPLTVGIDKDVNIPIWISTDPTPGNPDTVSSMHLALQSTDAVISGRLGGSFDTWISGIPNPPFPTVPFWDDISFLTVDDNTSDPLVPIGSHSQSIFGVAYLTDPADADHWIYTLGAWLHMGSFKVHTANDPALIPTTVCPFSLGHNTANGSPWLGMSDGVRSVAPTTTFGCLFFSPNAAPVWVAPTVLTLNVHPGVPFSIALLATDTDTDNSLTITGPGTFALGPVTGGTISGTFTSSTLVNEDLVFDLFDGTDHVLLTVHVLVPAAGELVIGNGFGEWECAPAYPGGDVVVPIWYNTDLYCGGFDILIGTDITALTLTGVEWTTRIDGGNEFHQQIANPYGMIGVNKFVWVSDMNNGHYHAPAPPIADPILKLTFHVDPSITIGYRANINFITVGPDQYTYNTTSDSTGYDFLHPDLVNGCVSIYAPDYFRGDPNMNGIYYEIADDVLVARRLIHGASDSFIWTINIPVQEGAADLNGNGFADIADLVRFINITTGAIPMPPHPKTDPSAVDAYVSFKDGSVAINSAVDVGGALVRIAHTGEIGVPVVSNGMDMLYEDANGVLSVVVYSQSAQRIPAGTQTLFTVTGNGTISEASAADANGELLVSRVGAPVPTAFAVSNNYPNPFNAQTRINFALPTASDVTINIYSITGQVVETLKGSYEAGNQSVIWDASHVASGVYFAKVSTGSNSQTLKMTLLK